MSDIGVDDRFMKELGSNLGEGEAALILLVREMTPDKVRRGSRPRKGIQTSLDNDRAGAGRRARRRDALTARYRLEP